ncbi:Renin-1 precursor [Aphelenchoides avenae]|nr:Renin-1 precursor [Aphelenchus avenae]
MAHPDPSSSDDRTSSTVHSLAKAAGGGQVTIFINREARDDAAGTLTLGGKDGVNCGSKWHRFKVPGDHDYADVWHLHAQSVGIGKGLTYGGITIVLDHFNRISLPGQIFGDVMRTLNATKNSSGTFSIACADVQRLPDIVLSLTSSEQDPYDYHIPATDYTAKDTKRTGRCALLLTPDDYLSWTIGIPALKSHCWMLDFDNNSIGVANVA